MIQRINSKSSLGFRYPCDGPGRGGTCQITCNIGDIFWQVKYASSFFTLGTSFIGHQYLAQFYIFNLGPLASFLPSAKYFTCNMTCDLAHFSNISFNSNQRV